MIELAKELSSIPNKVVIIDDDASVTELLKISLEKMEIPHLHSFSESRAAWDFLKENKVDLIVMDWKLSGISGLALFNRLRNQPGLMDTPIVVVSGYLHARDFSLMDEMPFTTLVEKPFNEYLLFRRVKDLYRDWRWFQAESSLLSAALSKVAAGTAAGKSAFEVIQQMIDKAPRPIPIGVHVAKDLVNRDLLDEAEKILRRILRISPDCVPALTELGKVLLKKHRFAEASVCLRSAQKISPENLDRLCLLGDVSLQTLDPEKAQEYFQKALVIDGEAPRPLAGMKISGNLENYLGRSNVASIPSNFASLLNAIGISLVRTSHFDEGIQHYHSALSYVDNFNTKSKLAFNLGLAHLRNKDNINAELWFKKAIEWAKGNFAKASTYFERLSGSPLPFDPAWNTEPVNLSEAEMSIDQEAEVDEGNDFGGLPPPDSPVLPFAADLDEEADYGSDRIAVTSPLSSDNDSSVQPYALPELNENELYSELKGIISNLTVADESLFESTGKIELRDAYRGYNAQLRDYKIAIFIPTYATTQTVGAMSAAYAKRLNVIIMCSRDDGKSWQLLWPRPAGSINKVA